MGKKTANNNGLGGGGLLEDAHHSRADALLLAKAVRERWPIPPKKRKVLARKLMAIVEEDVTTIVDEDGKAVEVSNARNQAAAARVLVAMDSLNQSDDQLADKNARIDAGKPTEIIEGITIRYE